MYGSYVGYAERDRELGPEARTRRIGEARAHGGGHARVGNSLDRPCMLSRHGVTATAAGHRGWLNEVPRAPVRCQP